MATKRNEDRRQTLLREREQFEEERDHYMENWYKLDKKVKELQHQLQETKDENTEKRLRQEISTTLAKKEVADSGYVKADANAMQRYFELKELDARAKHKHLEQVNSEKLAEHWKNTAEKYEDGVRTSEEHLKELEIEKEKEPEEGVLCIAPPEECSQRQKAYTLPKLKIREDYTCIAESSSCLVYASKGFSEEISIDTIAEPRLLPKLQANEIGLTPVIRILPQQVADTVIIELMKTVEPNHQNPKHELVPLYSLSHPFEWKKLPSHGCEMLEDRVVFKTTHFGYLTVIAQFSLPTESVTVEPSLIQPAQLVIQELPGFKLEIPSTSVRSKTNFVATVHYDDPNMYDDLSNHSPASACVVLEPHNTHFEDKIMVTLPIPNYDRIKRNSPNVELELWHSVNAKKGEPVKLKIAEKSDITIHQDDHGNYLATAHVTHFSGFMYLWNSVVDYCMNYFVQNISGRCQVFMTRESKHGSWISFGIAVLLYPFKDPYSSLPNHPYMLCDSSLPITLTAGEIECQIELDELLLQGYGSARNTTRYTECRTFPSDFNMQVHFKIRLHATSAVNLKLPEGIFGTLLIKHGSDESHTFNLVKPSLDCDTEKPMTGAFDFQDSSPANNEPQVNIHPMENVANQLICTAKQLKDNVMVTAAKRMANHMKSIAKLDCSSVSDKKSLNADLFDILQGIMKESQQIDKVARKVAAACTDKRLKQNVLEVVDKIPTIAGQLRVISRGAKSKSYRAGSTVLKEAIGLLTQNAKSLINAIREVLYAAERAIIKLPASEMERLGLIPQSTPDFFPIPCLGNYIKKCYYLVLEALCCNKIDDVPTLAALSVLQTPQGKKIHIIKKMAPFWRDLGSLMDFDESGSEVVIIDRKHRGDPKDCCRAVFQHWVNGNGVKPYSWRKLIELMKDCEQEALAEEIQTVLSIAT